MSGARGGAAGKVTIAGLAERLGMSKASVSYALNGQPGVSEPTRARVLARSPEQVGSETFYMTVLAAIVAVLSEHDLNLMPRMVTPGPAPGRDLAVYGRWAGERL